MGLVNLSVAGSRVLPPSRTRAVPVASDIPAYSASLRVTAAPNPAPRRFFPAQQEKLRSCSRSLMRSRSSSLPEIVCRLSLAGRFGHRREPAIPSLDENRSWDRLSQLAPNQARQLQSPPCESPQCRGGRTDQWNPSAMRSPCQSIRGRESTSLLRDKDRPIPRNSLPKGYLESPPLAH